MTHDTRDSRECQCELYARHGVEHPRGARDCAFTAATEPKQEKWRANYVPAPHFYNLNQACALINRAFGGVGCYLVGSSLVTKDYRDVDVRLMLMDEEFDHLFRNPESGWLNPFWSLLCTSISLWLRQQTDLPIDFQIQRMTQANETHRDAPRRMAIGVFLDYPGERPSEVTGS